MDPDRTNIVSEALQISGMFHGRILSRQLRFGTLALMSFEPAPVSKNQTTWCISNEFIPIESDTLIFVVKTRDFSGLRECSDVLIRFIRLLWVLWSFFQAVIGNHSLTTIPVLILFCLPAPLHFRMLRSGRPW